MPSASELRVAPRQNFLCRVAKEWESGGYRSSAVRNFSSVSGGTAAAKAKYEGHEACAASNSAAGEIRLHHEKMLTHFPSL